MKFGFIKKININKSLSSTTPSPSHSAPNSPTSKWQVSSNDIMSSELYHKLNRINHKHVSFHNIINIIIIPYNQQSPSQLLSPYCIQQKLTPLHKQIK